jgi:hypothetical protein
VLVLLGIIPPKAIEKAEEAAGEPLFDYGTGPDCGKAIGLAERADNHDWDSRAKFDENFVFWHFDPKFWAELKLSDLNGLTVSSDLLVSRIGHTHNKMAKLQLLIDQNKIYILYLFI